MRIWQIAFFIFVLQLMVNLGGTIDLGFTIAKPMDSPLLFNSTTMAAQEKQIENTQNKTGGGGVLADALGFLQTINYIISGVGTMIGMFAGAVINTEVFIKMIFLGALPEGFTSFVAWILRVLYIIGIVQLFLGRSVKGDD